MSGKLEDTVELDRRIGERIASLRKEMRMSRKELAAQIHITHQQLHKYETGVNRISASRLIKLCEALDVSAASFLSGIAAQKQEEPDKGEERNLAEAFVALPEGSAKVAVLTLMGELVECSKKGGKGKENVAYPEADAYKSQPDEYRGARI